MECINIESGIKLLSLTIKLITMKINADIIGGGNRYTYDTETGLLTDNHELEAITRRVYDTDYFKLVGLLIQSMNDMYHKKQFDSDEFKQTNELLKLYLKPELPF